MNSVDEIGIHEVRKFKGYHDEPLKGKMTPSRSIRLSGAYRAVYTVRMGCIVIEEVTKHEYKN